MDGGMQQHPAAAEAWELRQVVADQALELRRKEQRIESQVVYIKALQESARKEAEQGVASRIVSLQEQCREKDVRIGRLVEENLDLKSRRRTAEAASETVQAELAECAKAAGLYEGHRLVDRIRELRAGATSWAARTVQQPVAGLQHGQELPMAVEP